MILIKLQRTKQLRRAAFLAAVLLAVTGYSDSTYTNLTDTAAPDGINETGLLTLTNDAASSYSLGVTSGTFLKTGTATQTLTGALSVGGTAGTVSATISGGTLNLSGTGASLNSVGTVAVSNGAKLLFTGAVPRNTGNPLTIDINAGGTLEFTNMATDNHAYDNALVGTDGTNVNKGVTISGSGTLLKSGTGTLCLQYNTGGKAKIALTSSGLIDIQSGKFVAGGWSDHDWSQNYATLNIGAGGTVDHWDGKIMQVGGLTGDAGAQMVGGANSTDAARAGFKIGAGTTADQTFTYNGTVTMTSQANGKFIKTGAGTQIMTGAFSNIGTTTIESGTLKFTNSVTIGAGGLTVAEGAAFDISEATALVVNGTVDLKNLAYTIPNLTGNTSGNIIGTGTLTLTAIGASVQTYSGIISGDRSVVYNPGGSNLLMLPGQSTFTGGLTITNGILRVGAAATLDEDGNILSSPLGVGTVTLNNGTIQNHGDSNYEYASPTISNDIVLVGVGSIRSGWSGMLVTLAGNISGTGRLEIANDSSSVKLSGTNNTYSGGTKIGGGINSHSSGQGKLILGAANALGTGPVTFGTAGSTLDMNGYSAKISSISGGNGTVFNNTETLSTLELTGVTGDTTYSGLITGNVQLVVGGAVSATGNNQLTLSGANTYTGGTTVKDIVVRAGVSDAFDPSGVKVSGAFGMGTITLNNGTIQNSDVKTGTESLGLSPTISNDIVLADGAAGSFRAGWSGQILEIAGNISGTGRLEIANDSSSVKLSGTNNTYTGGTKIGGGINSFSSGQGTLILGSANALGTGPVWFGANNSTLQLAGFDQTFGGLDNTNGLGGYYTGNSISNSGDALTLTLDVAAGETYAYGGTINNSDKISLVKTGEGTQILASSQSFAQTTISEGVVMLSGASVTLSGPLFIEAGAAITTDPTDGFFHEIAGSDFGAGKGDLLIMIDSATDASRFAFTNAPTYDSSLGFVDLLVADDAQLSTSASFLVSNVNPGATGDSDLESWLLTDLRYEWNLTWDQATSSMTLQRDAAAVPEPSTWILLVIGAIGLLSLSKKRKDR